MRLTSCLTWASVWAICWSWAPPASVKPAWRSCLLRRISADGTPPANLRWLLFLTPKVTQTCCGVCMPNRTEQDARITSGCFIWAGRTSAPDITQSVVSAVSPRWRLALRVSSPERVTLPPSVSLPGGSLTLLPVRWSPLASVRITASSCATSPTLASCMRPMLIIC